MASGHGALTLTVLAPRRPSAKAVMVAVPGAIAVTTPAGETVTAAGLSLDQVTGDSLSVAPTPSLRVTVIVNDWPRRGLAAPTGAQFGASPARSTLWLPALSPDSVTVPFDGMTRPAPPSMATL